MGQGEGSKRWTAAQAREVLAEAKQSGESLSAYAGRHGIDAQRLYSWRRKLEAEKAPALSVPSEVFVPVRIASETRGTPACGFEVVVGAGRVVRVGADFDAEALRRLVEVLEEGAR